MLAGPRRILARADEEMILSAVHESLVGTLETSITEEYGSTEPYNLRRAISISRHMGSLGNGCSANDAVLQ
jgi:hypothetical protein